MKYVYKHQGKPNTFNIACSCRECMKAWKCTGVPFKKSKPT